MLDPRTPYAFTAKNHEFFDVVILAQMNKAGQLCFSNFERGRMLDGRVIKHLKDGIIFRCATLGEISLTPLTMKEFDYYIRPELTEYETKHLHDLDDVYSWYRRKAEIT